MQLKSKSSAVNAVVVLNALLAGAHAQEQSAEQPEEIVMNLPLGGGPGDEQDYITFKDKSNIINAVKGYLDPWSAASYSSGMSALPATLPKKAILNLWNTTETTEEPAVYTVGNAYAPLSDCVTSVQSSANLTTVETTRAWKLVYFDGSNDKRHNAIGGNLATYIYDNQGATNLTFNQGLCQWIDGKYDGFMTLEDTLRIVKCQANDDSTEIITSGIVSKEDRVSDCQATLSGDVPNFSPKTRSDYLAITGLKLHWDYAISAYGKFLPGVADVDYPSINSTLWDKQDKFYFDDELTMVAEIMPLSELKPTKVNWQAHVETLTQMYAEPLLALVSASYEQFTAIVNRVVLPYTISATEDVSALNLCIERPLPNKTIQQDGTPTEAMLYDVLKGVMERICTDMLDLHANMTVKPFIASQEQVNTLIRDLAWSEFKQCSPACTTGSVCLFDKNHLPECVSAADAAARYTVIEAPVPTRPVSEDTPRPTPTSNAKPKESVSADEKKVKKPSEPVVSATPDTEKMAKAEKDEL